MSNAHARLLNQGTGAARDDHSDVSYGKPPNQACMATPLRASEAAAAVLPLPKVLDVRIGGDEQQEIWECG
jgi:hypothetical protein